MSTSHDTATEKKVSQLKKYSLAAGERSQAVKVEAILFFGRRSVSGAEASSSGCAMT